MGENLEISVSYKKVFELLNKVSGVQELIDRIAEFTGGIIVMTDIVGQVLSASDEEIMQRAELFECLVMELYKQEERNSEVRCFYVEEYDMNLSVGSFSIKGNEEGFIFVLIRDKYVATQLTDIVRQAVEIITERSGRRIHCHASVRRRALAKALFEKEEIIQEQLEESKVSGPFLAAILQAETVELTYLQKLENEIIDTCKDSIVYIAEDKIYLLLFHVYGEEQESALHRKLEIFSEENALSCAASVRFEELELLKQKKFLLLQTLREKRDDKKFHQEYDFYLEMVCSCAYEKIGKARYMEHKLQKLWEEDCAKGTEFYRSLKEYLLLRNNVSATAKRLFIHRNTMIYRLSRVTEILGVDINEPITANNLLISMILQETERKDS